MSQTRRSFFYTIAGAGACLAQSAKLTPAPDVEWVSSTATLPDYSRDLTRYLVRLADEAGARRRKALEAITTREQFIARQKMLQRQFWEMLGGPFEKAALNPRVTGVLERPGYRIEKLIYESRPQLYVAANLYVPVGRSGRKSRVCQGLPSNPPLGSEPNITAEGNCRFGVKKDCPTSSMPRPR